MDRVGFVYPDGTYYYFIWYCADCEGWHIASNDPEINVVWIYESAADAARDVG